MNDVLQQLFECRPMVHTGETETTYLPDPKSSFLGPKMLETIHSGRSVCWGIEPDVAEFLYDTVRAGWNTLETGCGITSLIFALKQTRHFVITPNAPEVAKLKQYAQDHAINLGGVTFEIEPSESYLPRSTASDLDLVLLDGKHAFPWPVLDWFFTAEKLKVGGLLLVDDTQLSPVQLLVSFLEADRPRWKLQRRYSRTDVFKKVAAPVHDVAWHMQPFAVRPLFAAPSPARWSLRSVLGKLASLLRG